MNLTTPIPVPLPGTVNRWRNSRPPLKVWLQGSLSWAVMIGLIAFAMLSFPLGWGTQSPATTLSVFLAAGALSAFGPALWVARRYSQRPYRWPLFAVLLALATAGFTATLLALQYRIYFAPWHGTPFSTRWMYHQFFTFAGSTYQYVVVGLRIYGLPGLAALLAISWWATRKAD